MNYRINVARQDGTGFRGQPNWLHWFKVEGDFAEAKAIELAREMKAKFPDCKVDMTVWQHTGQTVDFE